MHLAIQQEPKYHANTASKEQKSFNIMSCTQESATIHATCIALSIPGPSSVANHAVKKGYTLTWTRYRNRDHYGSRHVKNVS